MGDQSEVEGMGIAEKLSVYKDKKVFITGHTGFKGAWLLLILRTIGAKVKGYALAPEPNSLFELIDGSVLCEHIEADIRNQKLLFEHIQSFEPDFIFHLAAQPLVLDSYDRPLYTFEVNALGTAHVLEAARSLNNTCSMVVVTTDKVYRNDEKAFSFKESDALGGYDPYSASKACTELVSASYKSSFFQNHPVRIATARAGNVIGFGDHAKNRILPDIIRYLNNKENIVLRNPQSVRPWQHVLDCLNGYLTLAAKNYNDVAFYSKTEQTWNFGPDESHTLSVEQLTQEAIEVWGSGNYVIEDRDKKYEAMHLALDSSKSMSLLLWKPIWDAKQAIESTVSDYMAMSQHSALYIAQATINNFYND